MRRLANDFPHRYGGFVHPKSVNDQDVTLIVSQWVGGPGGSPYWTMQFDGIAP